jgi:hypothetical protein
MVRDHGKVTQVAILGPQAIVEVTPINMRGLHYQGLGPTTLKLLNYCMDLVDLKRIELEPLITHKLDGFDKLPLAMEITGNKAKFGAINPAQVMVSI